MPLDQVKERPPRAEPKRGPPAGGSTMIELPELNVHTFDLTIVGDTPLMCHAWSKKARTAILDKQTKKASAGRDKRDPERDFLESLYPMPEMGPDPQIGKNGLYIKDGVLHGGAWGFPVIAFKAAAVTACTSIASVTKVEARQAFHMQGERSGYVGTTPYSGEFVRLRGAEPRQREDMVRIGMGTADIRFRAEFFPWWTKLTVRLNVNVMSPEQVAHVLNTAGFGVGIGEWRSEKDGMNGLFHVGDGAEVKALEAQLAAVTAPAPRKARR